MVAEAIGQTVTLTGNVEGNVGITLSNLTTTSLPLAWTSLFQDVVILSTAAVTLYTNGVQQINTATVVGASGVTGDGNATVVVTAAGMTGSPRTLSVPVTTAQNTATLAGPRRWRRTWRPTSP